MNRASLLRWLPKSLRRQLMLGITLVMALTMSLYVGLVTRRQQAVLRQLQADQAIALANSAAVSTNVWVASRDFVSLQEIVEGLSHYPGMSYVIVLDREGEVLAHNDRTRRGLYMRDLPAKPVASIEAGPSLVDVICPILLAGKHLGWVRIGLSDETFQARLVDVEKDGIRYLLLAVALGMAVAWLASRTLTRRLKAIQEVADAVKAGQGHRRANLAGEDEAAQLAFVFDSMLDTIAAKEQELINHRLHLEDEVALRTEQLKEAQEVAEKSNRSKGEFLSNMSHEIRTPMNAVIGMTRIVLGTALEARQRRYVQNVLDSSLALLGILNDILDFSKIEAGKLDLERVEFELASVLDNLTNQTVIRSEPKGVELLYDIDPAIPPRLVGDPLRLGQVLANLCGNAVKFTPQGEIVVRLELLFRREGCCVLGCSVSDTGIGIPAQKLPELFQSFSQLDPSTTRRYGGTGLGLAICKQLVEMMGGGIEVESVPGQGSTFRFTAEFGCLEEPPFRPEPFAGKRILVVDANPTSCTVLRRLLESLQLPCRAVPSMDRAREALAEAFRAGRPFDLQLVDARMPEAQEPAGGLQDAPRLAEVPTMVMATDCARERFRVAGQDIDAKGILVKPVIRQALRAALTEFFVPGAREDLEPADADKDPMRALEKAFLSRFTVLLVEDNEMNIEVASAFLADIGVRVRKAGDGREAISAVNTDPDISLVLMDIQMPGMDGLEATRLLRSDERFAGLPILAMTAHAMAADRQRSREVGMNGHITKPLDPELLRGSLLRTFQESHPLLWEEMRAQA